MRGKWKSFAWRDLSRRRIQTTLTILGVTLGVFVVTFLILFGENLRIQVVERIEGELSTGFANVFSKFLIFTDILVFLGGVLLSSSIISGTIDQRRKDIGMMKAVGCLTETVYGYFVLEVTFIALSGTLLGVSLGVGSNLICTSILRSFRFQILPAPPNIWLILLITITFFLTCSFIGMRPVIKTVQMKPASALSSLLEEGFSYGRSLYKRFNLGLGLKIALRSIQRRKWEALWNIICLSLIIMFVTTLTVGGAIASFTTQNYVERALGRDILLIGYPDVLEDYVSSLSISDSESVEGGVDLLNPEYSIPESICEELSGLEGVLRLDRRLIIRMTVHEIQGMIIDPDEPGNYMTIGNHRSTEALLVGIDPENVVSEWLVLGERLEREDRRSVVIGDTMAFNIFTQARDQKLSVSNCQMGIKGLCLDPLNRGYVAYVPLEELQSILETSTVNLILLKMEEAKMEDIILKVRSILGDTVFGVVELNPILKERLELLSSQWNNVLLVPFFAFIAALLSIVNYMALSTLHQKREFAVMRTLGAKSKTILKIAYLQGLIIIMLSGAMGMGAAILIDLTLLIPNGIILTGYLSQILLAIAVALALLSLSGIYPTLKFVRTPIVEI